MGTLLALNNLLEVVGPEMDTGFALIIIIMAIIIAILPIILFFKVWRMCNDVKDIKDILKDIYHNQEMRR